jgi:hypothetical protein
MEPVPDSHEPIRMNVRTSGPSRRYWVRRDSQMHYSAFVTRVAKSPQRIADGPLVSEPAAREAAERSNARYGGPGFGVEDYKGAVDPTPHAYVAQPTFTGRWYVVLTRTPAIGKIRDSP